MTAAIARPPLWMPLATGLVVGLCLVVMSLPVLGNPAAAAYRALFLGLYLVWLLPLTLLQRALARWPLAAQALLLLVLTYAASLSGNLAAALYAESVGERAAAPWTWLTLLRGRGVDGLWLALLAQAAVHALLQHAFALQSERMRAATAQRLAREAELRALRLQLQPHFLFNTLNAVSSLVASGRGDAACAMLAELADFLRATLEADDRHEVSLAEELAHLDSYLAIERQRLGPRLELHIQIAPDLLACRAPRLLLQPLAENAIRHGLALLAQGGELGIRISADGDAVRLQVHNDAPLADRSAAAAAAPGLGIGLANLRARLEALYPQAHELSFGRSSATRFEVCVHWPLRPA